MTRIPVISLLIAASVLTGACSRGSSSAAEPVSGAAPGRALVSVYCAGCHVPPRPQARAPGEWAAVVARMQEHRLRAGMPSIPAGEMAGLIAYLEGGEK